jgi:hypothetical protein
MSGDGDELRGRAISSIKAKNHFWYLVVAWIVLSILFVAIWAFTGGGPFWPIWPIAAGVVAVILVAIRTFAMSGAAPDEERIQREMRKLG